MSKPIPEAGNLQGRRLVIFDGISGVPLARDLHAAFVAAGVDAVYVDGQQLGCKTFYNVRSKVAKSLDKLRDDDGFYHLPRVNNRAFVEMIEEHRPDLLLVVGFLYRFVDPEFVGRLRQEKKFSLLLYDTDSCNFYSRRREFVFFLERELPVYDRILSFSKVTTQLFRDVRGLNASYFPFGARPIPGKPAADPQIDVLFVGSADLRRVLLLEKVREVVSIYGSRWDRHRPLMSAQLQERIHSRQVWGEELHDLLHGSKIVLNITRSDFFGAETGLNLRIFEALAAGCFLLTDYCDELRDLFRLGEEIETYRGSDELAEKIDYFLRHDDRRQAIAARGHERFCCDFTWQARVREFLTLGL
jgi:spore maturation protein CgeB